MEKFDLRGQLEDYSIAEQVRFCELYTAYFGDKTDKIKQIASHTFSGVELFEFYQYATKDLIDALQKISSCPMPYNTYEMQQTIMHVGKLAHETINKKPTK